MKSKISACYLVCKNVITNKGLNSCLSRSVCSRNKFSFLQIQLFLPHDLRHCLIYYRHFVNNSRSVIQKHAGLYINIIQHKLREVWHVRQNMFQYACNLQRYSHRICLSFRSTWEHPQFLVGFVLFSLYCSILCLVYHYLSVFSFLFFYPWRCQVLFDLWVWLSLWYLSPLLHNSAFRLWLSSANQRINSIWKCLQYHYFYLHIEGKRETFSHSKTKTR